ncbi:hypothetical protein CFC21_061040 [Triticum aestivum]|uniref:DUF4220 domain-containing protein n=3 Tax=Triticinae TaxID=1648030 RepID=A0A9R1GV75_WHEAT|nr:uncharacterized protein LOC109739778 [Aegilops tauschii subsp. strangulata]KAF7053041.1 hypothetical protein CFC21_061040 [Triticum aestivum]
MAIDLTEFLVSIGKTVWNIIRLDGTTHRGRSVELWVVLTTVLLLANFAVDSFGARFFPKWFMKATGEFFVILNASSVTYTLGLMEPSMKQGGGALSNFFHVWAVLIVTMQYSVQVGRPIKGKELTLVDLISSVWAANLLRRSSAGLKIRLPLCLILSLNVLRIVRYYLDSIRAADATAHNMKLVSDYMASSRHTAANARPDTMAGYRYLVHGEEEHEMEILRSKDATPGKDWVPPEDLITLETVWTRPHTEDKLLGKNSNDRHKYKDVCLSFALYKMLRRRFFGFPIPEANNCGTSELVFKGILEETDDYERAFRVTEVELSFLGDFSYGKHAVVFAAGFPVVRLLLSVLMIVSLVYTVYAIRDIPSAGTYATADEQLARVTHGVGVTRWIIAIITYRELWEIRIYVWSQWTRVVIICHYVRLLPQQGCISMLKRLVMEKAARFLFRHVGRSCWNQEIQQYNLILESVNWRDDDKMKLRTRVKNVKLQAEVKKALLGSLKALDPTLNLQHGSLGSYLQRAFQGDHCIAIESIHGQGETHKILVWLLWHVATGLCQIKLLETHTTTGQPKSVYCDPGSEFVGGTRRPEGYVTAMSLSNYCAYLVSRALVPDNGLVAKKVFDAVRCEAREKLTSHEKPMEVYDALMARAKLPSILNIGAELSKEVQSAYGDPQTLWAQLAKFWAGYLLHLSANTRAGKHQIHLQGGGAELATHLWALLSHAGFLGNIAHGHQMLDPEDLGEA